MTKFTSDLAPCAEILEYSFPIPRTNEVVSNETPAQHHHCEQLAASMAAKLQLYCYWLSSCAHRVRIALGLKGLDFEYKPVNLSKNEQSDPEFEKINPVKYVPVLVDGDIVIADSLAIILYLEDKYPQFPLLPRDDIRKKALNLQVASIVGSSIQPLLNIPAHRLVKGKFTSDEAIAWAEHHISRGFAATEKLLEGCAGRYATGDEIQLADVFLAPQIYVGLVRFKVDMSQFPTLLRLHETYTEHPIFQASDPKKQPDAPFSA